MRLAAALLILWIIPASAADTVAVQAHDAYATFTGGLSQRDYLSGDYAKSVFQGTNGKWARLGGPDPKTGIETYGVETDKICASPAAATIAVASDFSATITNTLPAGSFTVQYSLVAGSTFADHTDLVPYLAALGLGPEKTGEAAAQQRAFALSIVNGLVQIYRPSPDVLVVTRDRGYPLVLARCPAS